MAIYRRGSTLGLRPLTRRTGANSRLALVPRVDGRNESAAIAPEGDCSQRPIVRPSTGYAARSIARCAATRRWLVRLSAMTSQTDTAAGFQPRSAATCAASRRFRSSVPTVSWTSTSVGLELDHQERSARRVPRQDVDDAALAVDRERDLGRDDPLGQRLEHPRDGIVHRRVAAGEQPVELRAFPPCLEGVPDPELVEDALERAHRHPVEPSALDARDRRLREADKRRRGRPAESAAGCARRGSTARSSRDPSGKHRRSRSTRAYRRRISRPDRTTSGQPAGSDDGAAQRALIAGGSAGRFG